MSRLHTVSAVNGGPWCGPYALACVTGQPMETFIPKNADGSLLRRGMRGVTLQWWLDRFGLRYTMRMIPLKGFRTRPRLGAILRPGERGIASVNPGHLVAFDGLLVDDNHSQRKTWVHDHPYARHGVRCLYVVQS